MDFWEIENPCKVKSERKYWNVFLQNPFIGFKDFHLLEKQILDSSVLGCSLKTFKLSTVEPGNSKLFEKQQKVYYCQKFTIERFWPVQQYGYHFNTKFVLGSKNHANIAFKCISVES